MADLNALNSTDSVKIAGADASGLETNFVNATANGDIRAADILTVSVVQGTVSATTGAAIELKVGGTPLINRKSILIQAQGSNVIYGFNSTNQFFTIASGTQISLTLGPGISIWVKRSGGTGGVTVAFAEFA